MGALLGNGVWFGAPGDVLIAGEGIETDGLIGGGGTGSTTFFGVEARGQRFLYIVDISGSMTTQGRLTILTRNLAESIDALPPHTSIPRGSA